MCGYAACMYVLCLCELCLGPMDMNMHDCEYVRVCVPVFGGGCVCESRCMYACANVCARTCALSKETV